MRADYTRIIQIDCGMIQLLFGVVDVVAIAACINCARALYVSSSLNTTQNWNLRSTLGRSEHSRGSGPAFPPLPPLLHRPLPAVVCFVYFSFFVCWSGEANVD